MNGVAQLILTAVQNAKTGLPAFSYNGALVPPTIRVNPGDQIKIHYVNMLPKPVGQPFMNMTNLHFHGVKTSPTPPGDDVLDIMVMPGKSYDYDVQIPTDESPGMYWYHPHPHGESNRQIAGGMSGIIIVNGIEKYYPRTAGVPEQVLILRDAYPPGQPVPTLRASPAHAPASGPTCSGYGSKDVFLNGVAVPSIAIHAGETQFWRFANASSNTFADIAVDGAQLGVIARDGEPIVYRDRAATGVLYSHYFLPPAGRVEFFIVGPNGSQAKLRSLCVDTGPAGDVAPNRVLANINSMTMGGSRLVLGPARLRPTHKPLADIRTFRIAGTKTIVFTEDKPNGKFYINGQLYDPTKPAQYFAKSGTVESWTIVNATDELHAFHIHQIHFLVLDPSARAKPLDFQDTVTVPYQTAGPGKTTVPGTVHLLMDFTDPIVKGTFVFHCHILEHEDGGMMQKITVR